MYYVRSLSTWFFEFGVSGEDGEGEGDGDGDGDGDGWGGFVEVRWFVYRVVGGRWCVLFGVLFELGGGYKRWKS